MESRARLASLVSSCRRRRFFSFYTETGRSFSVSLYALLPFLSERAARSFLATSFLFNFTAKLAIAFEAPIDFRVSRPRARCIFYIIYVYSYKPLFFSLFFFRKKYETRD